MDAGACSELEKKAWEAAGVAAVLSLKPEIDEAVEAIDAVLIDVLHEEERTDLRKACGDIRTVPLANAMESLRAVVREVTNGA